ncbi:MAG TPA: terminase TerL endonuclease subunit [Terriglobia bacterium]|nr:terminase TerL endonuclease subunit [Terriglobia bacterium]
MSNENSNVGLDGMDSVGRLVRLAYARHEKDLSGSESRGLWFDAGAADRAVKFFELLRHYKGEWAGRPFHLERWQSDAIIRPLFGWRRQDGTRRFRTGYISVARKNGKSPLAAGIALYLLIADHEAAAEVYAAATKKDQAKIVYEYAAGMGKRSPELRKWTSFYRDSISVLRTGSKLQALSSDAHTLDGLSVSGAVVDELHAHKTRQVWDVLDTATSARRQPLIIGITTAGYDRKTICWEVHQRATQILEGALEDDSFFAYIATIDDTDDWRDESCWIKANPNLGVSKKLDYLRTQAEKAKETPAFQNTFRRLDLNQWTEQASRAIDMAEWHAAAGRVSADELQGSRCFAGLDLSSVSDLTALDLEFPVEIDGRLVYKGLTFFWLPESAIARRSKRDGVPYDVWVDRGLIRVTPGNVVDYDFVRRDVNELATRFEIEEVAYDPWNCSDLAAKLQSDGLKMVECRQIFRTMSSPTKWYLGFISDKRLEHGNNAVMNWMASNLAVSQDPAGNLKPDKAKSTEKIDGQVAKIMALGRALLALEGPDYERGLIVI